MLNDSLGGAKKHHSNKYIINKNKSPEEIKLKNKEEDKLTNDKNNLFPVLDTTLKNFDYNEEDDKQEELPDKPKTYEDLVYEAQVKYYEEKYSCPFFPAEEINYYTSDIRHCLDRVDKLYINQVWEILHELLDSEEVLDDDGEVLYEASTKVEGIPIPVEDLKKLVLLPAFDAVQEITEKGYIEVDDEEIPVTCKIEDPQKFEFIIDWDKKTLSDGNYFIPSAQKIRNIFAPKVKLPNTSRKAILEQQEADDEFMRKIIYLGDIGGEYYAQLTPIEKAVYVFLDKFFTISKNYEILDFPQSFVNYDTFNTYRVIDMKGIITEEDFLSVTNFGSFGEYSCVDLTLHMFIGDKIRYWNGIHSLTSIVDKYTIPELKAILDNLDDSNDSDKDMPKFRKEGLNALHFSFWGY